MKPTSLLAFLTAAMPCVFFFLAIASGEFYQTLFESQDELYLPLLSCHTC